MSEKLTDAIAEILEAAEREMEELLWFIDLLAIPDETMDGLRVSLFSDVDKEKIPPGLEHEFEKCRRRFEALCDSMPHVSRECLKSLGYTCALLSFISRDFENGELTIKNGLLNLTTAAMSKGSAFSLRPEAVNYLFEKHQAKQKAKLSEAGRQGAIVKNLPHERLKIWALGEAKEMRDADIDIARRLAARLPAHLADISKNPERLIYDTLRNPTKPG